MKNEVNKFIEYCRNGNLEQVKHFVNQYKFITDVYIEAVRFACENGNLEVVKYLIEQQGVNIYSCNYAVLKANINGHLNIVKYFFEKGINTSSYISWASVNGHLDIVKYHLYEGGGDINKISNKHRKIIYNERRCAKKIHDFYKKQQKRKKILSIWRQIVPLYYHPEAKGGYFLKKNAIRELEELF